MSTQHPSQDQAPPPQHPGPNEARPWGVPPVPAPPKKKHRFLKVLGAIVAVIIGIVIISNLGGGGEDTTSTGTGDEQTADEPKADQPKADDPKADEPESDSAGIGDPVKDGDFTFVVTKVAPGPKQIGDEYLNTKPQGKFVFVYMTITNHGDEPGSFFGDNQYLYDTNDRKASADTEAAIYLEDSASLYEEINPGNKVEGIVVFDVSADATADRLELHDSALSGGVEVALR